MTIKEAGVSLADILDPLQQPLVTVLDTPVSWTEVLGFGSGALCVWLVARQHLANWPIGIDNNLFFILLFTQSGLYADAGLQIFFITLAVYGWWTWTHGGGPGSSALPVRSTTRTEWAWLCAAGVAGTLTDHDGVAFEDDGLRDGEELRPWMTDRFRAELTRTGRAFVELTGTHEKRLETALTAVDALLAAGWNFAAPLPERR
ncbi:nicotinamide riboside transporter PnuC [Streptomyces sp. NPDC048496]|uniref:nicotinamide riboside transporter PnuC n=1 Tax=Streptomyces sp. NPDC048496 TaxID=3365558 RepID=UPI00371BB8EC